MWGRHGHGEQTAARRTAEAAGSAVGADSCAPAADARVGAAASATADTTAAASSNRGPAAKQCCMSQLLLVLGVCKRGVESGMRTLLFTVTFSRVIVATDLFENSSDHTSSATSQ